MKGKRYMKADYKNWVPKGMAAGFLAGAGVLAAGAALAGVLVHPEKKDGREREHRLKG
jgi:hypothetical protein